MSFIDSYRAYCEEFTDSPPVFHSRIALSILSTVVGRKAFLWQGYKRIFPNLWVIIVAPSSFYRKSYSLGIAEDILRNVSVRTEEKYILPREFSHEKFVEILSEQPQGLLISYEFKTFMGMMSKEYMSGTQAMITELFDCPSVYDRKIKTGSYEIRDPYLNILSATTIDWLKSSIKDADLASGFLPRFLIVSHSGKKENSMPWQKEHSMSKRDLLTAQLLKISALVSGNEGCKIDDDAKSHYEGWYRKFENEWSKPSILSPFYARIQEYAKKLAILLSIDSDLSLKISKNTMKSACNMADEFAIEIKSMVEEDLTYMDRPQRKVIEALKQAGDDGITREDLIRKTRLLADRQMNPVLATLIQSRQAHFKETKSTTRQGADRVILTYFWSNGNHPDGD